MLANYRYSGRLHELLRDFGARLCDVDAIYRRTLAQERAQVQAKWWKRLWSKFWRRYTADAARAMSFMTTFDENQVIDIATDALGETLDVHQEFRLRHGLAQGASPRIKRPVAAEREADELSLIHI